MTWLVGILPLLLPLVQSVANAWGSSTGNSLQKVASVISSSPIVNELASIGGALFPSLDPTLHAAAAALLAAESHTGAGAWVQAALNIAQTAGVVQFTGTGASGNTPLIVDGIWGPHSQAALKAFQAAMKLPVTGMYADAEFSALQALLAKE